MFAMRAVALLQQAMRMRRARNKGHVASSILKNPHGQRKSIMLIAAAAATIPLAAVLSFPLSPAPQRLWVPSENRSFCLSASTSENLRTKDTPVDKHYRFYARLPKPKIMHSNLRDDYFRCCNEEGENILVIGDVHGCYEEMIKLHKKAVETINNGLEFRYVILVGDICNKGPQSARAIRHVRTTPGWYSVRGNHDQASLAAALGDERRASKPKYEWATKDLCDEDILWLSELPFTITIDGEFLRACAGKEHQNMPDSSVETLIIHAGLIPNRPLEEQEITTMITLREVDAVNDRGGYAYATGLDRLLWASVWSGPQRVIYGHDARRGLQQSDNGLAIGLDSGAVYGNELTGMVLPQRKLVSVPSKEYCPITRRNQEPESE